MDIPTYDRGTANTLDSLSQALALRGFDSDPVMLDDAGCDRAIWLLSQVKSDQADPLVGVTCLGKALYFGLPVGSSCVAFNVSHRVRWDTASTLLDRFFQFRRSEVLAAIQDIRECSSVIAIAVSRELPLKYSLSFDAMGNTKTVAPVSLPAVFR